MRIRTRTFEAYSFIHLPDVSYFINPCYGRTKAKVISRADDEDANANIHN